MSPASDDPADPPRPPVAGDRHAETARRTRDAVRLLYGTQAAAAAAWGMPESRLSAVLSGERPPTVRVLEKLARDGVDVTALFTGAEPPTTPVPLLAGFPDDPGGPPAAGPAATIPVPTRFAAAGTYAVRFDADAARRTLGGSAADRPRPGDVLAVVVDVPTALHAGRVFADPAGAVELPPPVVLLDGRPVLSFLHAIRLFPMDGAPALRLPVDAPPAKGAGDRVAGIAGPLPAVGFAVWRVGPVAREAEGPAESSDGRNRGR